MSNSNIQSNPFYGGPENDFETSNSEAFNSNNNKNIDTKSNKSNPDPGVIREIRKQGGGDAITLVLNDFPEKVELERKQPNSGEDKKGKGDSGQKIKPKTGPLKLNMELKYTSIRNNEYIGENNLEKSENQANLESPLSAAQKLEKLSLPIIPKNKEETKKALSKLPRLVEIRCPVITKRLHRKVVLRNQSGSDDTIDSVKELEKRFAKLTKEEVENVPDLEADGNIKVDTSGQTTPVDVKDNEAIKQLRERKREKLQDKMLGRKETDVRERSQSFVGYIENMEEKRSKFDENNTNNELVVDLTIVEVQADQLVKYANLYSNVAKGLGNAVRERAVSQKILSHGVGDIKKDMEEAESKKANWRNSSLTRDTILPYIQEKYNSIQEKYNPGGDSIATNIWEYYQNE